MKNRQVMVLAYFNFNLGDDLFIKILCERYPQVNFLLYAPIEYRHYFRGLPNIIVYPRNNIFFRLCNLVLKKFNSSVQKMIANKCDAIVQIGGSIFIQKENWNGLKESKNVSVNKPYFVLGANFGPFKDKQYYKKHYELFKQYRDVCFRDNYSYELFKDLDNVRKADDIVFQLNRKSPNNSKKNIIISVIKPSFRKNLVGYDSIYFQKIKEITVFFINKGYKVTLMSFCENEGDKVAISNILEIIPKKYKNDVKEYYYKTNIDEALDIISSSSYVVATRFHAMILGWVYNKPVFPISYSRKMNNVMRDINYKGSYIDLKKIDNLKITDVYRGIKTNTVSVFSQVENSKQHFKILDKFLLK